jgi:hypothetical protein
LHELLLRLSASKSREREILRSREGEFSVTTQRPRPGCKHLELLLEHLGKSLPLADQYIREIMDAWWLDAHCPRPTGSPSRMTMTAQPFGSCGHTRRLIGP